MWKQFILDWFHAAGPFAVLLSIIFNTIISILAVVPSFFLTAANITFFGFWLGTLISFLGEAIGAIVSFFLYRKGVKAISTQVLHRYRLLRKLQETKGWPAFYLVLALRLFPFAPSGLVTLAGATSKIHWIHFAAASTLGKVPALLLEAFSVYQVLQWNLLGKIILVLFSLTIIFGFFFKRR